MEPSEKKSESASADHISPTLIKPFGTGLTRVGIAQYDLTRHAIAARNDPAVAAELNQLLRRANPTPLQRVEDVATWATDVLKRYGMPDQDGMVMLGGCIMSALDFAKRDEESAPWFAAMALELIATFYSACKRQDGQLVAEVTWQLGVLSERCWWKLQHETAAEDGYRMRDGRKRGAAAGVVEAKRKAAESLDKVITAVRRAWAEHPGLSGKYIPTARKLRDEAEKYFGPEGAPLSVERMKKIIAKAHRDGLLKK